MNDELKWILKFIFSAIVCALYLALTIPMLAIFVCNIMECWK